MRHLIILLSLVFGAVIPAAAEVSVGVGIGLPNLSIGINVPAYPQLEPVPGYPVYYAPQLPANFFFYDGMYWAYQDDNWYASSWYNGPWALVSPMVVPVYILRVPVRYYRVVPVYFRGWPPDAPPRWGDYWGNDWRRQRSGWDQWNRSSVPAPAPLPTYQRQYSGSRYPSPEQQRTIASQNYTYRPHDPVVHQHYQRYVASNVPAPYERQPQRQAQPQQSSDQEHRPPDQVSDTSKPPRPTEQQPSGQEHRPSDQVSNSSRPPKPAEQPPLGQEHVPPGQIASTSKPPQEQHHQQPTVQERGPPDQHEQASKEPKQNPGGDQSGDKRPDKEGQQDNR